MIDARKQDRPRLIRDSFFNPTYRQMLVVLERYRIGTPDLLGRGVWISRMDLPRILAAMRADPLHTDINRKVFTVGSDPTRHVFYADFTEIFER